MISQLPNDPTYLAHEKEQIKYWDDIQLYEQSIQNNNPLFNIMDGPPFVSGTLHPGHVAVSAAKSIVWNHQTMSGFRCPYKLGYDCHGLPIENLVCKENNIKTLDQIREMGTGNFNKLCDETIDRYSKSWTPVFKSIGRLADFNDTYMTRDTKFMESCLWIFKQLWDQNLVYRAYRVMAYSWACQTPLSNFEAQLNYQEKETKSVYCSFMIKKDSNNLFAQYTDPIYFAVWTTTPWTLPSNLALCVGPELEYLLICENQTNKYFIASQSGCNRLFGKDKYKILSRFVGSDLVGTEYHPIFDHINHIDSSRKYLVMSDQYVKDDPMHGTNIVHLAPAFGEDDQRICIHHNLVNNRNISDYCLIDQEGCFDDRVPEYKNINAFEAEEMIRMDLKKRGILIKTELYRHSYPYCYRTDTPLIYRTTESFYINVTALKERMIRINKQVSWHPKEVGENRFHNWLENIRDWAISRFRFYGTPIPVWESEDGDMICCGSIDEIEQMSGVRPTDLHPQHIDNITIIKNNKIYRRNRAIFDCWFESGAVPFAQAHYPFDKKLAEEIQSRDFLSDFICEGMDQTRGWFYTLLVLSTAILNKPPYRHVMCTGMILDKNGQKFSKRLGNAVDPSAMIVKYGSDIVRTYMMNSPLTNAESLRYNEDNLERLRQRFIPLTNAVKFFLEHTINLMKTHKLNCIPLVNINSKKYSNQMDNWLLETINTVQHQVIDLMNCYQLGRAVDQLINQIEWLTNWYVKFNRDRLKGLCGAEDWIDSITVLYSYLIRYIQLWTPFMPMMMEMFFRHLKNLNSELSKYQSILLTQYIEPVEHINQTTGMMNDLQKICVLIRNMRCSTKHHNKQVIPLRRCTVYHADPNYLKEIEQNMKIIQTELNCLEYDYQEIKENILYQIVPDRKVMGPEYGKKCQEIIKALGELSQDQIRDAYLNNIQIMDLINGSYKIVRLPAQNIMSDNLVSVIEGDLMICIDTTYDTEIHQIYQLKRLHQLTQETRKKMGLRPWNRIEIYLDSKLIKCGMMDLNKIIHNGIVTDQRTDNNWYTAVFEYEHIEQTSGDVTSGDVTSGDVWIRVIDQ